MPNILPGVDTNVFITGQPNWAAARDATSGTGVNNNSSILSVRTRSFLSDEVYRVFMAFDTSEITVAPSSATLKLFGHNSDDAGLIVVKVDASATGDSSTNFVAGDFQKIVGFSTGNSLAGNTTDYSSALGMGSWDHNDHNEITLNATALQDMKDLSEFKIAILSYNYDYLNVLPGAAKTTNFRSMNVSAGQAAERPLISYVAGVAGDTPAQARNKRRRRRSKGARGRGFASKNISVVTGGKTVANGFSED